MRKSRLARIQLKWRNPYTEPPDNQPRIIFDEVLDDVAYRAGKIPAVAELEKRFLPGCGFAWHWSLAHTKPRRSWSKKTKAKQRRRNLKKRLQRQIPLFWQDAYQQELNNRPGYYKQGDPPALQPLHTREDTA